MTLTWMYFLLLSFILASCQDITNNESIEASRLKRENAQDNSDLTVLLVNDQKKSGDYQTRIGRYQNVKPIIGLLTSTARTFIQDGVTTEFVTQILGTTLDNGRIYAQLLTKSSLVLYNKANQVDNPDLVKPTRIPTAFDSQWNVKQDLGFIEPEKFVIKNTDYISPDNKMEIVYASQAVDDRHKLWNNPTPVDESDNQIFDEPTGRRIQPVNEIPRYKQNEAYNLLDGPAILDNINTLHRHNKPNDYKNSINEQNKDELNEKNIVKVQPNYDLPTFTVKNEFSPIFYYIDNVESRNTDNQVKENKLPKKIFGVKSEPKPKKTFTYAGFADFTTVVGDTVIVFTPNTDLNQPSNPDQVNVYPSAKTPNNMASKITFLASDFHLATSTYKAHENIEPSKVTTTTPKEDEVRDEKALNNDQESLEKVMYDTDEKIPDSISVQNINGFDLNMEVIQPSEAVITTTESTRITDELGVLPIHEYSSKETEPLLTLSPSITKEDTPTESSVIIDSNEFNDSEEETFNTSAENISEENSSEEEMTTTEPNDDETTTESEPDVSCTNGLITKSTTTTAYKTLTYLTTYFIPLEGTQVTTSVKSDVAVESDIGYLTNVVCKSGSEIEPTSVISVEVKSSIHSSIEEPVNEEITTSRTTQEDLVETNETQTEKEITTTPLEDEDLTTINQSGSSEIKNLEETTQTTTTTKERVEFSVSTEETSTSEKPISSESEENASENEIDVIYKTLYTTYTYLTTFFGDSTSSVASHKSVVTNIITSTIDLGNMDPSLLEAFDEGEIAPTGVGIGRPTATFAINSIIDLVKHKDVLESVENEEIYSSQTPTPTLSDEIVNSIKPDAVKTYFTTYTFFTTIFVGQDANICSRSEIYTNYIGPEELLPTKTNHLTNTRAQFDFRNCKQVKEADMPPKTDRSSSMEKTVTSKSSEENNTENERPIEVDMLLSVDSNPVSSDNSYVTDVKTSSSKGDRKVIENNNLYEDQISSESNIDEITPSPTLLLQTSYTTFTYFTTMYIGKDSSKIKSRLETITNVVTETISPKKEAEVEESNLPITYYTTFTYWTTLYKDKATTVTSREEIVSNVVTPIVQVQPTVSPIDTSPIEIESISPQKDVEIETKPSLFDKALYQDDDKATFYTTYTYFTTFYVGNTSQIRSSLETVTNIVDNTKLVEDNQLGRKVPSGSGNKNLIQDNEEKLKISPSIVKEEILQTKSPDLGSAVPSVLVGTYIDNLFAEIKPVESDTTTEKKILYSQVAVISGNSTVVTDENKTLDGTKSSATVTTQKSIISPTPDVIESSEQTEPTIETSQDSEDEEDDTNPRKKSRLTFTSKKPSFTPVIRPFSSRNRPTFSPKRQPPLGSATIITRSDFTPTITATPILKSVRTSAFGSNRKSAQPSPSSSRKFTGRSSSSLASNIPAGSRSANFIRGSISPTSRRTGFRTSSLRNNNIDLSSRSLLPKIRPTASLRNRGGRQSASVSISQNEEDLETVTQQESLTDVVEDNTETPAKTTTFGRFRRPGGLPRQPGSAVTPRSTTQATTKKFNSVRGRLTTTTRRPLTRTTTNPLLSLRRQRPNGLLPPRNLFKKPEPEPEEEAENQQDDEENQDNSENNDEVDNDYESSDRKEQQVATPTTPAPKKNSNTVQIRPFAFRRRSKRQIDYGSKKYTNFRRPGPRAVTTKAYEPEPQEEEPTTSRPKTLTRFTSRSGSRFTTPTPKVASRQPFIVRGESRTSTTSTPSYRGRKPIVRTTTSSTRPKAPRLHNPSYAQTTSRTNSRNSARSRTRGSNSRTNSRQRNSHENTSGERNNYFNQISDGKVTVTHQIPVEATIPIVNGKITEYKNILTAKPSLETLLQNQLSTTLGPLGNQQLYIATEATEIAENGVTRLVKFLLQEIPTTTVLFTPTTIRGRKTSYSHIVPSTIYNVERVTSTIQPEINANVPLANLLLSQLLLGNQQQAINPLLALQGQGLIPQQQPVIPTPVTELKTRTTTYVTTVTDNRETILPITFRGIPFLTTIKDPVTNVITATEYIVDTVVSTPIPVQQQQPQFNSLLLPLLLQQQQQQQAALALKTANPLFGLAQPDLSLVQSNNLLSNDIYSNSPKPNVLTDYSNNDEYSDESQDDPEDLPPAQVVRPRPKPAKPSPPKHTSIVTLYVSGRTPGEFSTVLSTVVSEETPTVKKREAIYFEDVKVLPSILPNFDNLYGSQSDAILENSFFEIKSVDNGINDSQLETQSLESIVGELNKHIRYDASPSTYVVKLAEPSKLVNLKEMEDY